MMSKASQIILLCEDFLTEVVVRRFLKQWGVNVNRKVRVIPYPEGKGSGELHVRKKYAETLKTYRSRSAQTVLIAVMDADTGTVAQHHRELDQVCTNAGVPPRSLNDAVLHVIPKHHIETWLAYLDDVVVDESKSYKPKYEFKGKESKSNPLVDRLVSSCQNHILLSNPPPSLREMCKEFDARIASKKGLL